MSKKIAVGLLLAVLFLPVLSSAEEAPAVKDEWALFQQKQREDIQAFFKKQKEDRDQFLKDHPQVLAKIEEQKKVGVERSKKAAEEARLKFQQKKAQIPQNNVPPAAANKAQNKK